MARFHGGQACLARASQMDRQTAEDEFVWAHRAEVLAADIHGLADALDAIKHANRGHRSKRSAGAGALFSTKFFRG